VLKWAAVRVRGIILASHHRKSYDGINMTDRPKQPPKPDQTPMERFTEAAKHIFNLPKSDVEKVMKKTPYKPKTRKRRSQTK
jgi:hypothetical protein